MWNRIVIVLVLASVGIGQTASHPDAYPASEAQGADGQAIIVAAYQRYSDLRRGGEQEIKIEICRAKDALPNASFCFPLRSHDEQFVPLALELTSHPDIAIHYREGDEYRLAPGSRPVTLDGRNIFLVKLHAKNNAPLGAHLLLGRLKFLVGDQGPGGVWAGNGIVQEVAVKIPVIIVDREAKVAEADVWPTRTARRKVLRAVGETLGAIPVFGIEWALCGFEFCDLLKK